MRVPAALSTAMLIAVFLAAPAWGLSSEEVVYLKQQGISDETIHIMIHSALEKKKLDDTSIRITEDEKAKIWSTGKPFDASLSVQQQQDVERAWNMLDNMFIDVGSGRR